MIIEVHQIAHSTVWNHELIVSHLRRHYRNTRSHRLQRDIRSPLMERRQHRQVTRSVDLIHIVPVSHEKKAIVHTDALNLLLDRLLELSRTIPALIEFVAHQGDPGIREPLQEFRSGLEQQLVVFLPFETGKHAHHKISLIPTELAAQFGRISRFEPIGVHSVVHHTIAAFSKAELPGIEVRTCGGVGDHDIHETSRRTIGQVVAPFESSRAIAFGVHHEPGARQLSCNARRDADIEKISLHHVSLQFS